MLCSCSEWPLHLVCEASAPRHEIFCHDCIDAPCTRADLYPKFNIKKMMRKNRITVFLFKTFGLTAHPTG